MAGSAQLRKENDDLRDLIVDLSKIILRNVVEQKVLPKVPSKEVASLLSQTMSPTEIVPRLREVAIHCAHVSRECADSRTAQELESLSVELADAAERLEGIFVTPPADQ
jgi:hypothetical protein